MAKEDKGPRRCWRCGATLAEMNPGRECFHHPPETASLPLAHNPAVLSPWAKPTAVRINGVLTFDIILDAVGRFYILSLAEILNQARREGVLAARRAAIYLCSTDARIGDADIAREFNLREPAAVRSCCQRVERIIAAKRPFAYDLERIRRDLQKFAQG